MRFSLEPCFITHVRGPGLGLRWKPIGNYQADAQSLPWKVSKERRLRHSPRPHLLIQPDNAKAECDAWTAADAHYTKHRDRLSSLYRHHYKVPRSSPYDLFMKRALPNIIRGLWAADYPYEDLPCHMWKLENLPSYFYRRLLPDSNLPIPPSCQTWGLHYARVHFFARYPHPLTNNRWTYVYYIYVEAVDLDRTPLEIFWVRHRPVFNLDGSHYGPWTDWIECTAYHVGLRVFPERTLAVQLDYAPPRHNDMGGPAYWSEPDLDRTVQVRHLCTAEHFTHWPRIDKTPRGFSAGYNLDQGRWDAAVPDYFFPLKWYAY